MDRLGLSVQNMSSLGNVDVRKISHFHFGQERAKINFEMESRKKRIICFNKCSFEARHGASLMLLPDLLNLIVYELLGIFPIIRMRKFRLIKIKQLAQGHTNSNGQKQNLNLTLKPHFFSLHHHTNIYFLAWPIVKQT